MIIIANSIAIALYLISAGYRTLFLLRGNTQQPQRRWLLAMGIIAVSAHGFSVFNAIYTVEGIDLGIYKISSLIAWFIAVLCLLSTLRRPTGNLLTALFPIAALSILASSYSAPIHTLQIDISIGILSHIIGSILAYSVLTLAALQAGALALQVHQLKSRHLAGILQAIPPLQTMEQLLFELIWIGIILLTLSIASGAIYLEDIFAQHLVHKTVLSLLAWCIFAILLWGRHQLGWRSQTAVRWTLGGFIVLMLGYFGSKLVLEVILNNTVN